MNYEAVNFYKTRKALGSSLALRRKHKSEPAAKLNGDASPADVTSRAHDDCVGEKDYEMINDREADTGLIPLETVKPSNCLKMIEDLRGFVDDVRVKRCWVSTVWRQ